MFRLILLFTLLPLAELSLLLRIGGWLGTGPTVGLVIVTGIVGAWLARREGIRTWGRVQADLAAGRMPGEELLHALLVFIAGVVLVTPGVLTDAAGLLLLVRPAREAIARRIRKRLSGQVQLQTVGFGGGTSDWNEGGDPMRSAGDPESDRSGGRVIEVQAD
ncbi:MAG: FxsA family protein [Gemmatimonadetes bacterium]|nr:FxsA family protein [Gemmatimonadota bacterium]